MARLLGVGQVRMMTEQVSRNRWTWRLWLITCLLFLTAAWQQPTKRAMWLALAVVFGIFAAAARARRSNEQKLPRPD